MPPGPSGTARGDTSLGGMVAAGMVALGLSLVALWPNLVMADHA